ncbi:MAG: DUF262 domain-containing protein [Gammaproteobacteria bacterium]|nr:DUF262 domain-containing protein [Gammaproteobacteria bacterium]
MNNSFICTKPITDLLTDQEGNPTRFWIRAYQRGYRWKPLQVRQLLDDIWEFIQDSEERKKESFYCLQPIVIKAHADGRFEVVDGQQRLTTIYIILSYLHNQNKMLDFLGKTRFNLTFETRGETNDDFLAYIDLERADENIDFFHICAAYREIEDWFSQRDGTHRLKFLQHLLGDDEVGKNVKVIWFQLSNADEAVDAFTRLNVGKIPLTNDELIRALFLRRKDAAESDSEALRLRIAYEWDQLEKSLQSDSFWYFISNEGAPKQNRIGFLFEFVAEAEGLLNEVKHDPYAIFHAYNRKLKNSSLEDEWLSIKQAYMMLEEWYEDRTLYHIIGFLIQQGVKIERLKQLSDNDTKNHFRQNLRQEIFNRIIRPSTSPLVEMNEEEIANSIRNRIEDLEYSRHNSDIRALLLLFNIATLLDKSESNIRFQFDCFKKEKWDIEHVRSVSQAQPHRHHERVAWLKNSLSYLEIQDKNQKLQKDINSFISLAQSEVDDDNFEALYKNVLAEFKEADEQEGDHSITNLTLLDSETNRSYKNAVFAVKRRRILSLDQGGIFIPLCTRNVFLKCYSPHVDNLVFWTDEDKKGYQTAIIETLGRFFINNGSDPYE